MSFIIGLVIGVLVGVVGYPIAVKLLKKGEDSIQ